MNTKCYTIFWFDYTSVRYHLLINASNIHYIYGSMNLHINLSCTLLSFSHIFNKDLLSHNVLICISVIEIFIQYKRYGVHLMLASRHNILHTGLVSCSYATDNAICLQCKNEVIFTTHFPSIVNFCILRNA